jgi:hypothetical protein
VTDPWSQNVRLSEFKQCIPSHLPWKFRAPRIKTGPFKFSGLGRETKAGYTSSGT